MTNPKLHYVLHIPYKSSFQLFRPKMSFSNEKKKSLESDPSKCCAFLTLPAVVFTSKWWVDGDRWCRPNYMTQMAAEPDKWRLWLGLGGLSNAICFNKHSCVSTGLTLDKVIYSHMRARSHGFKKFQHLFQPSPFFTPKWNRYYSKEK